MSVVALPSPPQWVSEKGLKMGGPRAFGYDFLIYLISNTMNLIICERLDIDYKSATSLRGYERPKSVWELYGDS